MKVVQINSANFGSTGNIMLGIAEMARKQDMECITVCPDGRSMRGKDLEDHIYIGNRILRNIHIMLSRITGYNGCFSFIDTMCFICKLKKIKPDVLHLHNLHNCYINLPLLFSYIRKNGIKVIWTLHDCWAFTGQCPHFVSVGCSKWKSGCHDCPLYKEYPETRVDRTAKMWMLKKSWFTGIKNMTIVTPSQWLADLVKESYLSEYPVKVINNGIDLAVFMPSESDFREIYGISKEQHMVLGVASVWTERKGLDVFVKLAEILPEDYKIVLVGTNKEVDESLPQNIISVRRTSNAKELAGIYTSADLLVTPTREDTFPTVNLEAMACGTPVLTFRAGGSPESIDDETGSVVECDDIKSLYDEIVRICTERCFTAEKCVEKGRTYAKQDKFMEYVELYGDGI